MPFFNLSKAALLSGAICTLLLSCQKNLEPSRQSDVSLTKKGDVAGKSTLFYALTASNELVTYVSVNPLIEKAVLSISGLSAGEKMLAIDFRPATGQLYGVSSNSILYRINLNSGMASPAGPAFSPAISGSSVGFDFNPTVDRIRLVTNTGQNLRLHPETGLVVIVDGNINPAGAMVNAVAYTNSFAGAATTTLYDIDIQSDKLFVQSPPNDGTLKPVGTLGIQAVGEAGFDISADNSMAIAAVFGRGLEEGQNEMSNGNKYRFYTIDLATGAATNAGKTDRVITGIAIPTMPVAYAVDNMNRLLIMNPSSGSIVEKNIMGLDMGDKIVGIDMRPATAQLYAMGMMSRIYTINLSNGMATAVGTMAFTPMLTGNSFAFDFNPTVDRIRVISNMGQNLRLDPLTGAVAAADPNLNPGMPMVSAAAYTNSFVGSATTTLYDIDVASDMLYVQDPANAGTLKNAKPLGIDVDADNGFDIGGTSNNAWGIFKAGAQTGLYTINLASGMATYKMAVPYMINGFAVGLGF
ncbi:MAG: DUF4394 domain-containing protein [Bacteroidota bacterium]